MGFVVQMISFPDLRRQSGHICRSDDKKILSRSDGGLLHVKWLDNRYEALLAGFVLNRKG